MWRDRGRDRDRDRDRERERDRKMRQERAELLEKRSDEVMRRAGLWLVFFMGAAAVRFLSKIPSIKKDLHVFLGCFHLCLNSHALSC